MRASVNTTPRRRGWWGEAPSLTPFETGLGASSTFGASQRRLRLEIPGGRQVRSQDSKGYYKGFTTRVTIKGPL